MRCYDGGNNDIFLASNDPLGHLGGPMHKKYSMTFIWGNPFSMCRPYDQFFDPSHISFVRTCRQFEYPRLLGM